ncbi:MAG: Fe-S cluster assembly ATPase SufC [Candidatus Dojkabacteria bacterium]|nr:MAG: Fe-S cluster assembly ATPase SufC [Candidatus Dojkabacteria bacterium]
MFVVKNLTVALDENEKKVLESVNISINPGEIHLVMGPNGAGKSTLAKALIGWDGLNCTGVIKLDSTDISDMEIDTRAREGLFYAAQNPVEVPGVHLVEFLRNAYNSRKYENEKIDPWSFTEMFEAVADELGFDPDFSERNLNEGFSGGEKKKCEILQMILLRPRYAVLDEIDSGLDIDSLKRIFSSINKFVKDNGVGIIVISHNPKILDYIQPDKVHLLKGGTIVESGDGTLAEKIISKGYAEESKEKTE